MKPFLQAVRAFTLVEILVAMGIVAILGTVGYVSITGVREQASSSKLEQDVKVLNNAIDAYLASGGSMDGVTTGTAALAKLKTRANAASAAATLGPSGAFIDPRTEVVAQTADEAATSALRAYFTTSPAPRFITATSGAAGIKEFTLNEVAAAAAPVTEGRSQPIAQGSTWVWNYEDQAPPEAPAMLVPTAVDAAVTLVSGSTALPLQPPAITPAGGTFAITGFPLAVTISNPNPTGVSAIYYSINNGPYVLYVTQFNANPGDIVRALCVTLDPSRYYNSGTVTETYGVTPLQLAVSVNAPGSVTYGQAGGIFYLGGAAQPAQTPSTATISLLSAVPGQYAGTNNFVVRYTTDGSDPRTNSSAPTASSVSLALSNWGATNSLTIRAAAVALNTAWFTSSAVATSTVTANPVALGVPQIFPTNPTVTASVTVTISNPITAIPATNLVLRYTTNGAVPSVTNSTIYSGPFSLLGFTANEQRTVSAASFAPSGILSNWFTPSATATAGYTGASSIGGIPSGALVGAATLNSTFNGNITIAYPTNGSVANITYNQNAVINGSLYVPGTPRVAQNSPYIPQWTPTNDLQFSNRIYGIVEGQARSPRVVDLTGPTTPTNYVITFNNNSYITGKIFRRIERYSLQPLNTSNFPPKTSSASLSLNGPVASPLNPSNVATVTLNTTAVGSVPLLPGTYGAMTANNNSKFVLGNAADPDTPVTYNFDQLTLNSGADLVIVGKVILNLKGGFNLSNGAVVGDVNNPDRLQINVWSSNVNVASGSSVYGRIFAPNNTIAFNNGSVLVGSVSAKTLELNSTSIVFSLAPPTSATP